MSVNVDALRRVCGEPYGFWLDSAAIDRRLGRTSFCGSEPFLVLRSKGACVELVGRSRTHRCQASPFEALRWLLCEHGRGATRSSTFGGAVGYLAYDLKRFVERVPHRAVDDLGLPDCCLGFYDDIVRFDPRLMAVDRQRPAGGCLIGSWQSSRPLPLGRGHAFAISCPSLQAGLVPLPQSPGGSAQGARLHVHPGGVPAGGGTGATVHLCWRRLSGEPVAAF
jgi:hypothetical protein